MRRLIAPAVLLAIGTLASATSAFAGAWYVANTGGSDANICSVPTLPCKTINGAIAQAQAGDDIFVTDDIYTGSGFVDIVRVDKSLHIDGGWEPTFTKHRGFTIINGEHQRRGLFVQQGATLEIDDVAIIWGTAPDGGGAYVEGGMVGQRLFIVQNRALFGGGIFFNGLLGDRFTLVDTALVGNEYFAEGGGLFVSGGYALLFNVTASNNISIRSIDEEHGTPVSEGGGAYVSHGLLEMHHATFAENTMFDGRNFTQHGAGVAVDNFSTATFWNTLIADGCAAPVPWFQFMSNGVNVERLDTCNFWQPQDRRNINPQIYPPSVNPGPYSTITHAIAWSSSALNSAKPDWCLLRDQRGVSRPQGAACDVGAYERAASDPAMGYITHPGMGFADSDRCPTLEWNPQGRERPNPCRVDVDDLIRAVFARSSLPPVVGR